MRLSIRARLTLWYCSIVVAVLVTGAVAGSFAQSRLSLQRLDDDLVRAMATLQGVMRTEFGEGLTLEASAEEASIEVVVPDRTLDTGPARRRRPSRLGAAAPARDSCRRLAHSPRRSRSIRRPAACAC